MPDYTGQRAGGNARQHNGDVNSGNVFKGPVTLYQFNVNDERTISIVLAKADEYRAEGLMVTDSVKPKNSKSGKSVVAINSYRHFLSLDIGGKTITTWFDLPEGAHACLPSEDNDIARVLWMSFVCDYQWHGSFFMTYESKSGVPGYYRQFNNDRLRDWVKSEPKDFRQMRIEFGRFDSYVAMQPGKSTIWKGIPQRLEQKIRERSRPSVLALGYTPHSDHADMAYVAAWPNGYVAWGGCLRVHDGLSEALQENVKQKNSTVVCVALDSDEGYYYIQFANGAVCWRMRLEGETKELMESVTGTTDPTNYNLRIV